MRLSRTISWWIWAFHSALSQRFELHSSQIIKWKKEFLTNSAAAFESKKECGKARREREHMLKKIGELELDKDYLKKTCASWDSQ